MANTLLEGWGSIAAALTQHAGFEISKDRARRWAAKAQNPLPIKRFGSSVVCDEKLLMAWVKSQFR